MEITVLTLVFLLVVAVLVYLLMQEKKQRQQLEQQSQQAQQKAAVLENEKQNLQSKIEEEHNRLLEERQQHEERQKELKEKFQVVANKVLDHQTQKLTNTNEEKLKNLLDPLKEKIGEYQKQIHENNKAGASLKEQLEQIRKLNQQLSQDAKNLTEALKGSSKTQGDWGELILEQILENAGLQRDVHYRSQESTAGSRPDVTLLLPQDRFIIIDSKVSLNAYSRFVEAETEEERQKEIKAHTTALRNHMKTLADKDYNRIHGHRSSDHVFMFIPIEPAFLLAVQHDQNLWTEAYQQGIVLISPTNLIAMLRIVNELWRNDQQNKNAHEIAQKAGALYDKFVTFTETLEKVGSRIDSASKEYEKAHKQLTSGNGNLVRRAEELKGMGINAKKDLKIEESEE